MAKHHYIPQLLLRNHVDEETGELFIFDKEAPREGIRSKSPRMVFREFDLYTRVDQHGVRDASQETRYQQMETAIRSVLDKIIGSVRSNSLPGLSVAEKRAWDEFHYEQWRRVPEIRHSLYSEEDWQVNIAASVRRFEEQIGRALSESEQAQVAEFSSERRFRHSVLVGALDVRSGASLAALDSRGLYFAQAPAGKCFAIGSQPTVRFRSSHSNHLTDHGVEFWLPIAHDVAVSPGAARSTEAIVQLNAAGMRKINRVVWGQSTKIAARSERLLASLMLQR